VDSETPSTTATFDPSSASEKPSEDELPGITRVSMSSSSSLIVDTPMQAKASPTPTERDNSEIYTDWEDGQTDAQTDCEGLAYFEGSGRPECSPSRFREKREQQHLALVKVPAIIRRRKEGKVSCDLANGAISDSNTIRPGRR
jgi:hypothetical protein